MNNSINRNINLCKILKGCEGMKIYCLLTGEYVTLLNIGDENDHRPIKIKDSRGTKWYYPKEGYRYDDYPNGECILVPSKDQWDWNKFERPIPIDTPMMCSTDTGNAGWTLLYYSRYSKGRHYCFMNGKKGDVTEDLEMNTRYMIPFDKFNPNNIEESLKYNIQK